MNRSTSVQLDDGGVIPLPTMTILPDTAHETIQMWVMDKIEQSGPVLYTEGRWWQFGPIGAWVPMGEQRIWDMVRMLNGVDTLEGSDGVKPGKAIRVNASMCESVVKLAQSRFNRDGGFQNQARGVVTPKGLWVCDAAGLRTRPAAPEDRVRLWVDRDPTSGPCTLWRRFLSRLWGHEEDFNARVRFIHEWMGSVLMGDVTSRQKAPILVGDGENGKSVVIDVFCGLIPSELRSTVTPHDLESNRFAAARLVGVAINHAAEIPSSEILTSAKIKSVIDGSEQAGERKNRDAFDFRPIAGHIFSANSLPPVRDLSHGFWRRFVPLTCTAPKIEEHEKVLGLGASILAAEKGEILHECLQAYALMVSERCSYIPVVSAREALSTWRSSSDSVQAWVEEECSPGGPTSLDTLFRRYDAWAKDSNHRPVGKGVFGNRLTAIGYPAGRTMSARTRDLKIVQS